MENIIYLDEKVLNNILFCFMNEVFIFMFFYVLFFLIIIIGNIFVIVVFKKI